MVSFLKDFVAGLGVRPRRGSRAHFELRYRPEDEDLAIGHLEFEGDKWTFRYDDAYRKRTDLRPLEGFEDLGKVYSSSQLFPFFAVRLPDLERPDIQRMLQESRVRRPDSIQLLRLFGTRAASSPGFELVQVN
jgi:HipA-like protein